MRRRWGKRKAKAAQRGVRQVGAETLSNLREGGGGDGR